MSTYGSRTHTIDELKDLVAAGLGLEFERHESDYRCGDYWLAHERFKDQAIIQENCLEDDGELFAPEFPDHRVLLYIEADLDESRLAAIADLDRLE